MSNTGRLRGPGLSPRQRASATLGDLADGLTGYAGNPGRIAELVEKHGAGFDDTVRQLVEGMPDSPDRRELLTLLLLVPDHVRRAGVEPGEGQAP